MEKGKKHLAYSYYKWYTDKALRVKDIKNYLEKDVLIFKKKLLTFKREFVRILKSTQLNKSISFQRSC